VVDAYVVQLTVEEDPKGPRQEEAQRIEGALTTGR